ncbi:MAG: thiamine phosphate synthase [Candidatus Gastranaerophilales bacterium]|nr:thiamine phosphate synthase [Candidatus Gastranaerophilales bacterium]
MKRIIDVNVNRATEALRILEEISRFYLNDENFSRELKFIRHEISDASDKAYNALLNSRDVENDVGTDIKNPTKRNDLMNIFKANFKRLEQSLRVLSEYAPLCGMNFETFEKSRYASYTLEKKMYEQLQNKLNKYRLEDKKLYLVTNSDKFDTEDEFLNAVASALKGGVQIVQLREKTADAAKIIRLGKKIRELCSIYNALFIVNDRIDIAQITKADGVHLGQDDADIKSARAILDHNTIVGISTHCPEQALKAVQDGADYIGVGPVFETPTKAGRQAVGLEYVEWAVNNVNIPFFAIGGIDTENVKMVTGLGAKRVAVVRAVINAANPETAAETFTKFLLE